MAASPHPQAPDPTVSGHAAARYYDRNTGAFLRFGGGAASGSIHRHLWGPGVSTTAAAASFVNVLIGDAMRNAMARVRESSQDGASPARVTAGNGERGNGSSADQSHAVVLDLGCGVGGTLRSLAQRFPAVGFHGVTISQRQGMLAQRMNADAGVADRCNVVVADFESLRLDLEADFVVAIESFVHSYSARRFFETAAVHLRPGGRLLLVDDFLRDDFPDARPDGARQLHTLACALADRFRTGWRAPGFCTVAECVSAAGVAGLDLVADRDLSEMIRLNRPRDRAIDLLAPLIGMLGLGRFPMPGNLLGGAALNRGLRAGVFSYRLLEFVRG